MNTNRFSKKNLLTNIHFIKYMNKITLKYLIIKWNT